MISDYPNLLSFLPLLYVAWSDDVLTPSESKTIKNHIKKQKWLKSGDKKVLNKYLDPARPPTNEQLKKWLRIIKKTYQKNPLDCRESLVDLGIAIATIGAKENGLPFSSQEAAQSLSELQEAMGLMGIDASRNLLMDHQRPKTIKGIKYRPSFSTKKMQELLDGEYVILRNKVRTLLADPEFNYRFLPIKEQYRAQVMKWCYLIAKQGFGALSFPKKYGGANSMNLYLEVFEILGHHDLSLAIKCGVQFGLFGSSVHMLGTKVHHDKYLKDIGTLALPGCFAMTETGHGSNVRDIETTAHYEPKTQEFIIHSPSPSSQKDYIGNAAQYAQMATVFAQLHTLGEEYGVHAFLVPLRNEQGDVLPGITISDCGEKLGLNGVDNGRILFDQVRIPRENLLNRFGEVTPMGNYSSEVLGDSHRFFSMLSTLVGGRIAVPKAGLSAAKCGLAIAIKYAFKRRQFGPAGEAETLLIDYKSHQRRLMPLLANVYALDFALKYLAVRYKNNTEEDAHEVEVLAAGLKAYATWNTTHSLQICREACGGQGYLTENRFAALRADTDIFTTFEGDNTVLMQLVAKGRLAEFKKEFYDINFFGLLNYITKQAGVSLSEMNPIIVRKTTQGHLRDSEFQLNAFRFREQDLLVAAAKRLKALIDDGLDSYNAFIQCQDHLIKLGHAYVERVILEQFLEVIDKNKDTPLYEILKILCDLFALHLIEKYRGWYLEQGYIEGVKSKAIRDQVLQLCKEISPDSLALVNSFAIPDSCLAAPIAVDK